MSRSRARDDGAEKRRIDWARGLSNEGICIILQSELHEARSAKRSSTKILNELVHEIRHRLSVSDYEPDQNRDKDGD